MPFTMVVMAASLPIASQKYPRPVEELEGSCPQCGETISPFAPWCPSCHVDLRNELVPLVAPSSGQAAVPAHTRRPPRRWRAVGLVVVALAGVMIGAAATAVLSRSNHHRAAGLTPGVTPPLTLPPPTVAPPALPANLTLRPTSSTTGTLLLAVAANTVFVGNPTTGTVSGLGGVPGGSDAILEVVGADQSVVVHRGRTFDADGPVFAVTLDGTTARLGDAVRVFHTAGDPTVWLESAAGTVQPALTNGDAGPRYPIPAGATLVGAVRGALLLRTAALGIAVWDPRADGPPALITNGPAELVAAGAQALAWRDVNCNVCRLHLATTAGANTDKMVTPVAGWSLGYDGSQASISPDGRYLVLGINRIPAPLPGTPAGSFTVGITDLSSPTPVLTLLRGFGVSAVPAGLFEWSPSGTWVFAQFNDTLVAHQIGTDAADPIGDFPATAAISAP
jgi:hypothetical protein